MCGQSTHVILEILNVSSGQRNAPDLRNHVENGHGQLPKFVITPAQGECLRVENQFRKPLAHHARIAKHPLKKWIQDFNVEQRFIHIKYDNALALIKLIQLIQLIHLGLEKLMQRCDLHSPPGHPS